MPSGLDGMGPLGHSKVMDISNVLDDALADVVPNIDAKGEMRLVPS
jgi:hypothetical protein